MVTTRNNILITGVNGQLGSELRNLEKNYSQFRFFFTDVEELDILQADEVENFIKQNNITYIINCAAYTAVDKAEQDSEMAYKLNAIGPLNLAKAAANNHAVLLHVSTDFVFDGSNNVPYTEEEVPSPTGVYGETKLQGEKNVQKELPNSYIIRTSWLYSNYGNNFVKTMIRLGKEKEELGVIFDQAGTPTYAADLASALMQMLAKNANGTKEYGIYHYSNEGLASWYDFTKAIHEIWNITCKVKPIKTKDFPTPAKRPHYSVLDKTKIKTNFSIEIPHWREALRKCYSTRAR